MPVNAECLIEGADCVIRPLAVGNRWTYQRKFYGILGDLQHQLQVVVLGQTRAPVVVAE